MGPGTYTLEQAANLNHLGARGLLANAFLPGMVLLNRAGMPEIQHWQGFHSNDITMVPVYTGLATLLGIACLGLLHRGIRRRETILAGLLLLNLVLAAGMAYSPRIASYFFLPGMNGPHQASMDFRGFALFGGVLLGARGMVRLVASLRLGGTSARSARLLLAGLPVALLLLAIPCLILGVAQFSPVSERSWVTTRAGRIPAVLFLGEEFLLQSFTAFLYVIPLVFLWRRRRRLVIPAFCLVVFFDVSSGFLRCLPAFAERMAPGKWGEELVFERTRPREYVPGQFSDFAATAGSLPIIRRHVSLNAYNPARPQILTEHPGWRERILANPSRLVVPEGTSAEVIGFSPNSLSIRVRTSGAGRLEVLQTWTPDWVVERNGRVERVAPATSGPFAEVPLYPGEEVLHLRFQPGFLGVSLVLLMVGYLILAVMIIVPKRG